MNQSYQRITRDHIESQTTQSNLIQSSKSSQKPNEPDSIPNPQTSFDYPEQQERIETIQPMVYSPLSDSEITRVMNDLDFGIARKDIDKTAKRYEWIQEEIDYLVYYIESIETEKTNRFANCLNLRTEASAEVKQYFHPHHVANSDRLKNGFNVALKRIEKSNM
jgi:hypothetical protein